MLRPHWCGVTLQLTTPGQLGTTGFVSAEGLRRSIARTGSTPEEQGWDDRHERESNRCEALKDLGLGPPARRWRLQRPKFFTCVARDAGC